MKTMKFLPLTLMFIAVFAVISCVQDDDYDIPTVEVTEPTVTSALGAPITNCRPSVVVLILCPAKSPALAPDTPMLDTKSQ